MARIKYEYRHVHVPSDKPGIDRTIRYKRLKGSNDIWERDFDFPLAETKVRKGGK